MASDVIHRLMRSTKLIVPGLNMTTRCGVTACVETHGAYVVQLLGETGGDYKGSYHPDAVTCRKCINLHMTGNIHGKPKRTADASQRHPLGRRMRGSTPLARAQAARTLRGA